MDIVAIIFSFGAGAIAIGAALYGRALQQGVVSAKTAQELATVKAAYADLQGDINGAVGQISLTEIAVILGRAHELSNDGFTAKEAQEIGVMIIDAMKK